MKKYSIIFLLVCGGIFAYFKLSEHPPPSIQTVARVSTGSIKTTVKSTGKVKPLEETTLSFSRQGTVTKILKNVGESVHKGELIAELDAKSVYLDIRSAEVSLANAKNNYNKLITQNSSTDILRAENTFQESQNRLILLQKDLQNLTFSIKNSEAVAEQNLNSLKNKVTLAQSDLDYQNQNIAESTNTQTLERDISNSIMLLYDIDRTLPPISTSIRDTLGFNLKFTDFYGDLGVYDPKLKVQVENLYSGSIDESKNFHIELMSIQSGSVYTYDSTRKLMESARILLEGYNLLLVHAIDLVDASPETQSFPATLHDAIKITLRNHATQISTKLNNISSTLATLKGYGNEELQSLANKNILLQKQNSLTQAENDLESAKKNLEDLKRSNSAKLLQGKQEIEMLNSTILLNKASLDDLKRGPTNTDLTAAKNVIQSAQIGLEKANIVLADYQLRATFDGIIQDVPWKIGSITETNEGINISTLNSYEVHVYLDQVDIVKVQPGMPATIVLDAFPNETFSGTVSSVSGTPQESSNVVSYIAKILLLNVPHRVYADMSATIEITVNEKKNILLIPTSSIHTGSGGRIYVDMPTGTNSTSSQNIRKNITIGLSDMNRTEVVSGLSVGDFVILGNRDNFQTRIGNGSRASGTMNQGNNSFFPLPGMGGPVRGGL